MFVLHLCVAGCRKFGLSGGSRMIADVGREAYLSCKGKLQEHSATTISGFTHKSWNSIELLW